MRRFGRLGCWLVAVLFAGLLSAENWRYGSVFVPKLPDGIELQRIGGEPYSAADLPGYIPGLVRMAGVAREGFFWQASNGVLGAYYGAGALAIERFEQDSASVDSSRSRMILSMAQGRLIIDSRDLPRGVQMLIELPMGKVHLRRALILLDISFDERTGIYDFRMISVDGSLRFTDRQGEQYFASDTQLLTGVGSSYAPSLEISDLTRRMREDFDLFEERVAEILPEGLVSEDRFSEQMQIVPDFGSSAEEPEKEQRAGPVGADRDRRPLVIEYVPRPKPLVPFRGEVEPLSEYEAELF